MVSKDIVSIDVYRYDRQKIKLYLVDGNSFTTALDDTQIEIRGSESKIFSVTRDHISAKVQGHAETDPIVLQELIALYIRNYSEYILNDDYIRLTNVTGILRNGLDAVCLHNSRSKGQRLICRIRDKNIVLQNYAVVVYEDGIELVCKRGAAQVAYPGGSFSTKNLRNALSEITRDAYANMTLEDIEAAQLAIEVIDEMERNMEGKVKNDIDEVYNLIEAADKCRDQIVLCLLGKPGIGKTEAVERFARDHGRNVVHIIASQVMPNEVSGMTMPNQETRSMDVFDHYRLSHMKDGDILFFDELLKGQQQVLNACLTLIQERRLMSGTKLPDVLIIAAANPLASASQLPPEIRQRFLFHKVEWKSDRWIKYMQDLGFDDSYDMEILIKEIERGLSSSMSDWNVLTPRTATKLCLWMRKTNCDPMVREYISREFGRNISEMINNISTNKTTVTPQMQIADTVLGILTENKAKHEERGMTPGYNEAEEYTKIIDAIEKAEEIKEKGDEDLSGLLAMLKELPIWDQIQDVLRNTKIE